MTNNQYKIKIHHKAENKKIYISIGINVGFAIRDFVYGNDVYSFKPGALLFLAKYKEEFAKEFYNKKINISVYASQTIFSFISSSKKLIGDIDIFEKIKSKVPSREEFPELFKQFKLDYTNNFSDEVKEEIIYSEFLHYHKRFSMDNFHKSIESLTFEDVEEVQKYLFQKIRYKVYIYGNVEERIEDIQAWSVNGCSEFINPIILPLTDEEVVWKGIELNGISDRRSYLMHTNLFQIPIADAYLTYQILSQWYSDKKIQITIDSIEMGAILPNTDNIEDFKLDLASIQLFKDNILRQYEYLSGRKQLFYSEYFMKLWLAGLDYLDFYLYLQKISSEEIEDKMSTVLKVSQFCKVELSK
ncbi:TPA: hypothetical protein U1U71_000032 [Streptococcus suis]|nr:hypothetical protein [Streptococcus suis]HEM3799459.1 hypothetical protein [Streptococcus suis]HEM3816147.1 hypothetical protein [Streptococcus suis]